MTAERELRATEALMAEVKAVVGPLPPARFERLRDGTALGCIGRCRRCGKAIQLRRTTQFNWDDKSITPGQHDAWGHFVTTDHAAVLMPGVCDA